MYSDRIMDFADGFDIEELIRRYDADFDVPLRHEYALGVLRMAGAFERADRADVGAVARRIGAHWCDIIHCDMVYDHWTALRRIEASRSDVEWLLGQPQGEFVAYVTARWYDGAGKIHYRLGSFARALRDFEAAHRVAAAAGLWWCLPDIRSNVLRTPYEQSRQAGDQRPAETIAALRAEIDDATAVAEGHGIDPDSAGAVEDYRGREFLRGLSSLLHNLALAEKDSGPGQHVASLRDSMRSIAISRALGDEFRIVQSVNHQALLSDDNTARIQFTELLNERYGRGALIARQQLARLEAKEGNAEGVEQLASLLEEVIGDLHAGGSIGTDVELADHTMRHYVTAVNALDDAIRHRHEARVADLRRRVAESVRRAVALPAYKRAYAKAVRPSFLERIAQELEEMAAASGPEPAERAFGLVEESSARELLDMMATAELPRLTLPTAPRAAAAEALAIPNAAERPAGSRRGTGVRRAAVTAAHDERQATRIAELARRETEFENQFLTQPLEAATHDPEIAHRLRMFTVNNDHTCVVRYFAYGPASPDRIGAFVFQHGEMRVTTGIPCADVAALVRKLMTPNERGEIVAPSVNLCREIWELLIKPVWREVDRPEKLEHLVLIPTDDIFAIPLHVAWEPGAEAPVAARVPLSQSVSATAFVNRGRSLLKRQPVSETDDLAAIVAADDSARGGERGVSGRELLHTDWSEEDHMILAGNYPRALEHVERKFRADGTGLKAIADAKPEFFIYAGHGKYDETYGQYGPYLVLPDGDFLTQYDVALRLRLPRNKLAVLGACLAGQGTQTDGGDIGGFLRALMATGAGAIGAPLWSVLDDEIVDTVRALLQASRAAARAGSAFDVVVNLHAHYRKVVAEKPEPHVLIESLPLTVYL
ncbi:CHAT domain-containing protein [Micromonospora kangleipakensis]|uniref:CHAT domain-containing protein n=1 Tax=Micromonospora kangleipakensis TaxID=1077942 RepID=A0A4Q8BDP3_9ACTN|nr:CHAT domain-containing protein [Micromonospora kangleipakensis]RZU76017.1 CHAT domain-containing protein [Micromonospora kangleipakensis]